MNKETFYNKLRKKLFDKLSQKQVDGIEAILDEWARRGFKDLRWLAYILATVYHETDKKMVPVKEYGGEKYLKSKAYYPYYGRDLVHTTWLVNYKKVKVFTGIDVVSNPDLIADLNIAAKVAIEFMNKGYYTGKKLADYFNDKKEDWLNARRIINGLDKATLISGYGKEFLRCLKD
ncbi:MAG TPA: hypothetical protein VEA37_02625 [Flavobacterium sp.]|nr:hypothetical protein [Flavobacterium sp.]